MACCPTLGLPYTIVRKGSYKSGPQEREGSARRISWIACLDCNASQWKEKGGAKIFAASSIQHADERYVPCSASRRILLEDWTSLHLDIVARDHGLNPLASSLYEL
jgi:hypothetical protein